jgi:hypothetical protein
MGHDSLSTASTPIMPTWSSLLPSKTTKDDPIAWWLWMVDAIITLPRLIRILMVGFFSIAVTLLTFPVMGGIAAIIGWGTNTETYLAYALTLNQPLLLGFVFVSLALGLAYYVVGWWLLVGTAGEQPTPIQAMMWVVIIGVVAVLGASGWLIYGVVSLSKSPI